MIFVLLRSVAIGAPVVHVLRKGDDAQAALNRWKTWVIENRSRALELLHFALGGILVINGWLGFVPSAPPGA